MRLLLVEDDAALVRGLLTLLRSGGYAVDHVSAGGDALEIVGGEPYNLIILDVGLPDMSGFDVLRDLRRRGVRTPVLILTARDALQDRIAGLDLGGDDYLLKPFEPGELEARVRALVRRSLGELSPVLTAGPLVFDASTGVVTLDGEPVDLRLRERAVLHGLLIRIGKVVPKERLAGEVFGYDDAVSPNALEVYVGRLRKKLAPNGPRIRTIRGLGYMIEAV